MLAETTAKVSLRENKPSRDAYKESDTFIKLLDLLLYFFCYSSFGASALDNCFFLFFYLKGGVGCLWQEVGGENIYICGMFSSNIRSALDLRDTTFDILFTI